MPGRSARSLHEEAKAILANCKPSRFGGDCLIWQGAVDDRGYGYVKIGSQKRLIHTLVALYGVERSDYQIVKLEGLRIAWTCGKTICMRLDSAHMHFATGKPEKVWEDASILDEIVRNAGLVETWR